MRDIPDIEGDRKHGINSLATRLGKEKMLSHVSLASILWTKAKATDLEKNDEITAFYMLIWKAISSFSCLIVYTNGVNQLFDMEIDKVNKPYLPLVSGEMSLQMGFAIVCASALMILSHVSLASILWTKAKTTDLEKNDEITAFYMLIWKLVYAEHCLIPLVK
ncbi:hypothetical protein HPP92_012305 [Vanilla planifolia]|uniref:Uncharacterized protein n=1 Tax=Vanilla planifolia TaxID=51239 RepID=A0A835V105_VANPL|nr:hypothetical protein HPP92_012305 [Vanilla planifolia]